MKIKMKLIGISLVSLSLLSACGNQTSNKNTQSSKSSQSVTIHHKNKPVIDWRKSSQNKPYPNMNLRNHNWLDVSIKNQRVYIMSPKNKVLYTMFASTGIHNSTPRGTFHIQNERGNFFYNRNSKEGAHYWTSWKDHGIYLFHTVPTNAKGKYLPAEAKALGKTAHSHGCIRLSVPDAKWINQHVPTGTKVVIK